MSTQMIKLQSNDNVEISVGKCFTRLPLATCLSISLCASLLIFQIERAVAERSILIKNLLEDIGSDDMTEAVPIPNVSPSTLSSLVAIFRINLHFAGQ